MFFLISDLITLIIICNIRIIYLQSIRKIPTTRSYLQTTISSIRTFFAIRKKRNLAYNIVLKTIFF